MRIVGLLLVFAYSAVAFAQTETNPTLWNRLFGTKEQTATTPAPAEKKPPAAAKKAVKKESVKKPAPSKAAPPPVELSSPQAAAESAESNQAQSTNNPPNQAPIPGPAAIDSGGSSFVPAESSQAVPASTASPAITEPTFWQRIFRGGTSGADVGGGSQSAPPQESAPTTSNLRTEEPAQAATLLGPASLPPAVPEATGPSIWQRLFGGGGGSAAPTTNETPTLASPANTPNAAETELRPAAAPPSVSPPRSSEVPKAIEGPSFLQRLFGVGGGSTAPPPSKAAPKAVSPTTTPNKTPSEAPATTIVLPSSLDQAPSASEKKSAFGLANVCQASRCDLMVLFDAPINKSTIDQFEQDVNNLPTGTAVLLNSISGDLNSGIRLGQILRQKRFNTRVGVAKLNRSVLTETDGKCFSACALAFMGGINRTLDPNDQFGVYALRSTSKTISDGDYRQALANLGLYVEQMGIDRRLMDQMEQIQGNNLELITYNTARLLNIDNNKRLPSSAWRMQALDDGLLIALISTRQSSGQFNVTLGITRDANQFRLTVFFKPQTATANLGQIAEFLNKNARLRIVANKQTINPTVLKPWAASGTGVQTAVILNNTELTILSSVLEFELNLALANKNNFGIDPSTVFGTTGLKGAIAALKK